VLNMAGEQAQTPEPEAGVVAALLPTLEQAQTTPVVRIPQLLSRDEVCTVVRAAAEIAPSCGRYARDASGDAVLRGGAVDTPAAAWETCYLHTGGAFHRHAALQTVRERMLAAAIRVDAEQEWGLLSSAVSAVAPTSWRNVEHHTVLAGGALADPHHFDEGSLVTVDILLSSPGSDFTGGEFQTLERLDEQGQRGNCHMVTHAFELGDALVFVSHKKHCVAPVKTGRRCVLVGELWHGQERQCGHRCTVRDGECECECVFGLACTRPDCPRYAQHDPLHTSR
jgi:predicted 2-oxoglutarate/Fe(II)-dependent dioxygenase YbiX